MPERHEDSRERHSGEAQAGETVEQVLTAYPQLTAEHLRAALTYAGESDGMIEDVFDTVQLPPGVGQGSMDRKDWY